MTRYELLDRIGVGGMAEIFRGKAVAAGGFEKPVAIKRILPHLAQDKRFVELLIAEAKVLSLLKHRNIVQIFDVGLGDDGKYFLVMEYVDGKDLGAVQRGIETKRKKMPFDLALHIGAEICEALEHAHSARAPDGKPMSLVHRDVSPSNVLLSRAGEVKLTDFGIAKRAEQEATGHGSVRGKFAYISPEQARNEHLDPRSDVFSVGVLLWELILNRRLFSGLGDLEALRAVREAQVPRPMEIDGRLTKELDQLLMSALSKDARQRPTAGQFGQRLRSLRYSLEVTVGDPATELAKIIDTADEVERASQQMMAAQLPQASRSFDSIDGAEATVFRIRTADAFSARDMAKAREVIHQFEEEETRQAQLSGDQLRMLRSGRRDSDQIAPATPPAPLPGVRGRRPTDEPTSMRPPLATDEVATVAGKVPGVPGKSTPARDFEFDLPPNSSFDSDESTRLVARSRDRRTPIPQRIRPPSPDPDANPGTIHNRHPTGMPVRREADNPFRGAPPTTLSEEDLVGLPPSALGAQTPTPTPLPPQPNPGGGPPGRAPAPPLPPTPMLRPGGATKPPPLPPPSSPSPMMHPPLHAGESMSASMSVPLGGNPLSTSNGRAPLPPPGGLGAKGGMGPGGPGAMGPNGPHAMGGMGPSGPGAMGPNAMGPGGPGAMGPNAMGGPGAMGPNAMNPNAMGMGPHAMGPNAMGPNGPGAMNPNAMGGMGPNAMGPNAMGPNAMNPNAMGPMNPNAMNPNAMNPNAMGAMAGMGPGPNAMNPNAMGPNAMGGMGPNAMGPNSPNAMNPNMGPNAMGMRPNGMGPGGMAPGMAPGGMAPGMSGMGPNGPNAMNPNAMGASSQAGGRPPYWNGQQSPQQAPNQGRASMGSMGPTTRRQGLQPWVLVIGALVMAALAFLITRLLL